MCAAVLLLVVGGVVGGIWGASGRFDLMVSRASGGGFWSYRVTDGGVQYHRSDTRPRDWTDFTGVVRSPRNELPDVLGWSNWAPGSYQDVHWVPLLPFAVVPLVGGMGLLGVPLVGWWRARRLVKERVRLGLCRGCGYDRRGIGAGVVCPECGRGKC